MGGNSNAAAHYVQNSSYNGFSDSYMNTLQHAGTAYQTRAGMFGQNSNIAGAPIISEQQKKKSRLKSAGAGGRRPMMQGAGTRILSGATLTRQQSKHTQNQYMRNNSGVYSIKPRQIQSISTAA